MTDQVDADIAKVQADEAQLAKDTAQLAADKKAVVVTQTVPTFPQSWCGHSWVNLTR